MPIDPTIPLGVQVPQMQSPLATMGQMMQLRGQQQQVQENALSMQAKQRALDDDDAVRVAMQQANGDPDAAIRQLEIGGHAPAAAALRTKLYEWRDKQASTLKTNLENTQTNLKLASQIAQGVTNENSFQSGKKAIAALLGPDMAAHLGDTYDPAKVKQAVEWGRTAQEHITAQHNAITEAQEAMKLDQAGKKDAPETFEKWTSAGSKLLSVAQDQSQWDLARGLLKQGGAPDAVLAQFPTQFSPEAVKTVTALGLSQKDKADIANQTAMRGIAQQNTNIAAGHLAEDKRHNAVAESFQDPTSSKRQDALEQQYRQVLQRTTSSRSGGMGLEDQKVNQAIHLIALMDQSRDPKTGEYHIPKAQYAELASGLATLVSPNGHPTDSMRSEIETRTAKGDLSGLITYITGTPATGSTQEIFKMLRDSIERQGSVAETNRESYLNGLRAMAPTDLAEDRRQKLEQALNLNSLTRKPAPASKDVGSGAFTVTAPDGVTYHFTSKAGLEGFKKQAGIQ